MWPARPDMSRDECRKCLRCLELDAFGNMVSVLRAQGPFTDEKQKLLGELGKVLHISNERHRAEIRRAVNDEKLSVIAEQLNGPNTCTDWAIEGRRTIPLLPRLKAHTAFTGLANSLSMVIAAANEKKKPVSNERKMAVSSRVEEPIVKAETESRECAKSDERPSPKVPVSHSETKAKGRKRKRSLRESPENDKYRTAISTDSSVCEFETNSTSRQERRVVSPSQISSNRCPNVVQVSIVTPSSTADSLTRTDNTLQFSTTQLTCSSTNSSYHHKINATPSTTTCSSETNYNDVQKSVNTNTIAPALTINQDIPSPIVLAIHPGSAKSKTNVTDSQTIIHSNAQQSVTVECTSVKNLQTNDEESPKEISATKIHPTINDDTTKISKPDSTTSSTPGPKRLNTAKLCLTTKPVITSSTSRMVTINSGSTASSGPGPPSVEATTTLTYKKLSPGKLNNHPGTKMGITLNSNKTLKIKALPNARLASKANVIVVKKGSSCGVTLSHGGKEVLGKVIMGGKNLCLASQKSGTSVSLMPHRVVPNNGEQTLTMLSAVNSNHAESLKSNAKTGNMIVLDIRQDVLDKNKVLSQFLEASGVFNAESKTATLLNATKSRVTTKNQSNDALTSIEKIVKTAAIVNKITLETNDKINKTDNEPCLYSITEAADSSGATGEVNACDILNDSEEIVETDGVLDAQTGIYNFGSTDGTVIEDHVDETIPTSGLDIFTSGEINLENFDYVEDEEDEISAKTRDENSGSPLSTVEKLNEISDS